MGSREEAGEGAVVPLQCKNLIVKIIWQQLHARKVTNCFSCFRHLLVFYMCPKSWVGDTV